MNLIENWLESNLNRKEIKESFHTALNFLGKNLENTVKELLKKSSLDVVFVHELAHFLDRINRPKTSRYKYASSIRSSRERIVAETFRSKMKPFPKKRTNYRGRTCELFARAIEEYYAIITNNEYMLNTFDSWDYYVNLDDFKKVIMPIVKDYLCYNQK